jgi:hypothetical protein
MSIYFGFTISNPFVKNNSGKTIFWYEPRITKNKAICIQLDAFDWKELFDITFTWSDKSQDHWGVGFDIGLFGFSLHSKFYDIRHSDYDDDINYDYEAK